MATKRFLSAILFQITLIAVLPAYGQISAARFGPPGGPYTQAGHFDPATLQWVVDNVAGIDVPKGPIYQVVVETAGRFNVTLVGYDGLDEQYSTNASRPGGDDCGAATHCAVLTLYCDATHRLHGSSTLDGIEGDDTMCVCTNYGRANEACRDIGVFRCINEVQCPLSATKPSSCISPRGDQLFVPENALPRDLTVTFSSPAPKPSPQAVPHGWSPIAEAIELSPALALLRSARMVIHYSDAEVLGYVEQSLAPFRFDEGSQTWVQVPNSLVDPAGNTLTFETNFFGSFGFAAGALDPDIDADGTPNDQDCAPLDPTNSPPGEVANQRFEDDKETMLWDPVIHATRYDIVRGSLHELPVGTGAGEVCLDDDISIPEGWDTSMPGPGDGYWYVVRAENQCGDGTYGSGTIGPRVTTTCP